MTLVLGTDKHDTPVFVGTRVRCVCGCGSVIEVATFKEDGAWSSFQPKEGRGLIQANVEVVPPDTELRPVPDPERRAQGARDMTRDALLADKTPDLSRFSVEELTAALVGAERELKNVQGANWPPLARAQQITVESLTADNEHLRNTLRVLSEHEPSWSDDFLRARAALVGVEATLAEKKTGSDP